MEESISSGFNNLEAGRRFAKIARAMVSGSLQGANSTYPFNYEHMLDIADEFNIAAIFCADAHHWVLISKFYNDKIIVYDPLFDQKGDQIYTYNPSPNAAFIPSRPLQQLYGLEGKLLIQDKQFVNNYVRWNSQRNYELQLPDIFRQTKLQEDEYNCGPLVLYAALVANKHTPQFSKMVQQGLERLRVDHGIIIE